VAAGPRYYAPAGKGVSTHVLLEASAITSSILLRAADQSPRTHEGENMRKKCSVLTLVLCLTIIETVGCERLSRPDVSGVWKGTIQASAAGGKEKWQGSAELTLNQNGDALSGTLVFTHPQAGRVQVPISSGIVSKDAVTFSGQTQFPLGGSIEVTFHGKISGTSLAGTTDMTSRGLFGTVTNTGPLTLSKQ